jgi:holo-[acyl-carrier protein] synthase
MGTGLRHPVTLHSIRILHDLLGRPELGFAPELAEALRERGIRSHHLSISDEKEMAVAFVVLER